MRPDNGQGHGMTMDRGFHFRTHVLRPILARIARNILYNSVLAFNRNRYRVSETI